SGAAGVPFWTIPPPAPNVVVRGPTTTKAGADSRNRVSSPRAKGGWAMPRHLRHAAAIFGCVGVAGGGIAAKGDARQNYQRSLADYRECLVANTANVSACEGKRLIMEADERAFNNMAAGIQEGGNRAANIIVQGR